MFFEANCATIKELLGLTIAFDGRTLTGYSASRFCSIRIFLIATTKERLQAAIARAQGLLTPAPVAIAA